MIRRSFIFNFTLQETSPPTYFQLKWMSGQFWDTSSSLHSFNLSSRLLYHPSPPPPLPPTCLSLRHKSTICCSVFPFYTSFQFPRLLKSWFLINEEPYWFMKLVPQAGIIFYWVTTKACSPPVWLHRVRPHHRHTLESQSRVSITAPYTPPPKKRSMCSLEN